MNMKKSSLKSRTLPLVLSMVMTILVLPSCKSLDTTTLHHTTQHYTTLHNSVDTVVVRDSVFVSERQKDDTVYLTRVEWRDRWRTRIERDTVVDVRIEKEVVQLPPERYVPKFYRWCTGLLLAILVLAIGRLALKRWL